MMRGKQVIPTLVMAPFVWILLAVACCAQPVAKIVGPSKVPPGELTVLSSTGSVGDNAIWIKPDGLTTLVASCEVIDSQIIFATTRQGSYEFLLIVADKDARIEYARHVVTVGTVTPDPDLDPPTDPYPPMPTPGKWAGLIDVSKQQADIVNDAATRAQLKQAILTQIESIKRRCENSQCPTMEAAQRECTAAIESVLLTRVDRFSKWELWRLANSKYMREKPAVNLVDYVDAMAAMAAGL